MDIKKENAEKIIPGMFVQNSKEVGFQRSVSNKIEGIVLFVTEQYICVDSGQQIFDDVAVCQRNSAGKTVLSSEELRRVFARKSVINRSCRDLGWPEWEYWHWGDALYGKTKPDGTPAESVDLCHGGYGWPHQSRGTDGKSLITKAKVRFVQKIYF